MNLLYNLNAVAVILGLVDIVTVYNLNAVPVILGLVDIVTVYNLKSVPVIFVNEGGTMEIDFLDMRVEISDY